MKRGWIIGIMSVALLSSCTQNRARNELPSTSPRAVEIQKDLRETVIPRVDLEYASVQDAIKLWASSSRASHPLHFDFKHTLTYPMSFSVQPTKQSAHAPVIPKVTVHRKNITSEQLLDEICQQSNFVWLIMGRVIVIKPNPAGPSTQS